MCVGVCLRERKKERERERERKKEVLTYVSEHAVDG